jgi:hypothetical protein
MAKRRRPAKPQAEPRPSLSIRIDKLRQDEIDKCELIIRDHQEKIQKAYACIELHLKAIRDEGLYLETHQTFEAYCHERWRYPVL